MTIDPTHAAIPDFDPDVPVFEVWVNGRRFLATQTPARAFDMMRALRDGRPHRQPPELIVVNDRRKEDR